MRKPLVMGNWKMHGSRAETEALLSSFLSLWEDSAAVEVGVCPAFIHLGQAANLLAGREVKLGGQDLSTAESGAHTGDISGPMLKDSGCSHVLVGHSERRTDHAESSALVAEKFVAAQAAGLIPVLCIGETLAEREGAKTLDVVGEQLAAVISKAGENAMAKAVIAYEPVWAIGTGLTATPEQAQEVHAFIRSQLGAVADKVQVLYGGSVKPGNAEELFAKPDIDGALVGGASLNAEDFAAICRAAVPV